MSFEIQSVVTFFHFDVNGNCFDNNSIYNIH
jgi:hypothetical protein